ncbi:MAG: WecB/TagA/CpsF family glycosyltransferase [Meiothermus sp.]|nr:WecB/TagA/CpsF family glycosyltransferase [Meiothermus sp.]
MSRAHILGLPVDLINLSQTVEWIEARVNAPFAQTHQVITINPEIIVRSEENPDERRAILEAELVVADGVGVVWAVGQLTEHRLEDRVAGSDLLPALFAHFGPRLRVFFLGSKPGIAELAAQNVHAKYGVGIAGVHDGYFKDEQPVLEAVRRAKPDLLLVGMGERQDAFIYRHKHELGAKVAIGVGGMLDVLSGEIKRVPVWAQRLKIEWLVRVGLDRKRWGRVPRLWKFVQMVQAAKRAGGRSPDAGGR